MLNSELKVFFLVIHEELKGQGLRDHSYRYTTIKNKQTIADRLFREVNKFFCIAYSRINVGTS